MRDANLSGANLSAADLRYANLSDADLSGANLRYANLSDADLSDADLSGADLRGTIGNMKEVFSMQLDIGLKENGYIRIVKENVNIPKTADQLEIEKKHKEEIEVLAKLKPVDYEEEQEETEEERLERFFKLFLEKLKVPGKPTL